MTRKETYLQFLDHTLIRQEEAVVCIHIVRNIRSHQDQKTNKEDRPDSIGWHGNALLLRTGIEAIATCPVDLPTLEPRGAISADLAIGASRLRIIGMHLDLSGLRRRHQAMAIAAHCASRADDMPTVLMGDLNEWSTSGGVIGEFGRSFSVLSPGRSFHARRPVAQLDRIMHSDGIDVLDCGVHHSALAARASDHLPVWADIRLSARPAR